MVGYGFLQHGIAKLVRGPDAFAAILHSIGVPGARFGPVGYEMNLLYLAALATLALGGPGAVCDRRPSQEANGTRQRMRS